MQYRSFAEETVQDRRDRRSIRLTDRSTRNIHDLVPVYLTSRTPTLYVRREHQKEIFFAVIESFVLNDQEIEYAFADGNVAAMDTQTYCNLNQLDRLPWDVIHAPYWNDFEHGRRQRNSEFLIYPKIPLKRIEKFVVYNSAAKSRIEAVMRNEKINKTVEVDTNLFF